MIVWRKRSNTWPRGPRVLKISSIFSLFKSHWLRKFDPDLSTIFDLFTCAQMKKRKTHEWAKHNLSCWRNVRSQKLITIGTNGDTNVNAKRPWQTMVTITPLSSQKMFRPSLSMAKPQTGEPTAETKYTKLYQTSHTWHSSQSLYTTVIRSANKPRAGSGVVRMDPLRFLTGCRTRRLNQV